MTTERLAMSTDRAGLVDVLATRMSICSPVESTQLSLGKLMLERSAPIARGSQAPASVKKVRATVGDTCWAPRKH
jgi:hypothetical protein